MGLLSVSSELKQKVISMAQESLDAGKEYRYIHSMIRDKLKAQGIKLSRKTIKKYNDKALEENKLELN